MFGYLGNITYKDTCTFIKESVKVHYKQSLTSRRLKQKNTFFKYTECNMEF